MKPFDLEKALNGAPVVTRDGRDVEGLHLFKDRMELTNLADPKAVLLGGTALMLL